jgi:hypothetical protein
MNLAATWNPRGEAGRLMRLMPALREVYDQIVIVIPPEQEIGEETTRLALSLQDSHGLMIRQSTPWAAGRYLAIKFCVELTSGAMQYADLDRLLRWAETRPEEWRAVARRIPEVDCLVIGRTPQAYATHPQAIVQTEAISNRVVSHFLGKPADVSAGSKGFSRRAAQTILEKTRPLRALGTDAEWPLALHKAGYLVEYVAVDGLDWESADRYRQAAAEADDQRRLAQAYDADPLHWEYRVNVAHEIITAALQVMAGE